MAVSSTQSTSGSSIDVASIVSGLMEAEKVPVTRLEAKISKSTFKISALGQIKSQMSAFKTALTDLQTPTNFYTWDAKFSSSGFVSGQITLVTGDGTKQDLKPGDFVVQVGAEHTWINDHDEPCIILCVMLGIENRIAQHVTF
jgi:flagellar capping protein FliD